MSIRISLRNFRVAFSALATIVFVGACANDEMSDSDDILASEVVMVGGANEPTFNDVFDVDVQSPIQESALIAMLEEKGIQYRTISGNLPPSRHRRDLDVSRYVRVIEIYGGKSKNPAAAQIFHAYIDKQEEVEFIENAFAYAPP